MPYVPPTSSTSNNYSGKTVDAEVVLTGFGPFGNITDNPSFRIVQALPNVTKAESPPTDNDDDKTHMNIGLLRHNDAVHVAWETILKTIPQIYDRYVSNKGNSGGNNTRKFIFHIGAGYNGKYEIETRAHRDGYQKLDVDGKLPPVQGAESGDSVPSSKEKKSVSAKVTAHEKRGYPVIDEKAPEILHTGIDVAGVVEDVKLALPNLTMPIDQSTDAGRYMCDFIFYTSLREAGVRFGEEGKNQVLFIHVPPDGTLEEGVQVVLSIIQSVVRRDAERR